MCPHQFIFNICAFSIELYAVNIAKDFGMDVNYVSWITHVENLVFCSVCIIVNRIHARFGLLRCYLFGAYLTCVCNLLIFVFAHHFALLLALRAIGAFGFALIMSVTGPLTNTMVYPEQLNKTLAMNNSIIPCGYIVAAVGGGFVVSSIGWRYMFLIAACLGIVFVIPASFKIPLPPGDPAVKFDFFCCLLAMLIPIFGVTGFGFLSLKGVPYWVSVVLILCCIGDAFLFFWYNKNKSERKLFPIQVMNRN